MTKILICLMFIYSFILPHLEMTSLRTVSAATNDTYFARIMTDGVLLYRSPLNIDDYSNMYFELPKTYFVELLDSSNSVFYKVNYLNFTGYVKKESVQTITGSPLTPYLKNINFRIYAELSRELRSEPTDSAGAESLITYIPLYSKNLTYFGIINGTSLIPERTETWYYCKYTADKTYEGYVYSDFCDQLTIIKENTEEVIYTTNPTFEKEVETNTSLPLNTGTTGIIIAILSVPAVIFIFMMLKGTKILNKEKEIKKEIRDY